MSSAMKSKFIEEYEKKKKDIKKLMDILNKIVTKRVEKIKTFDEIVKIIPSNDENESDSFFLDIFTSFIYFEVCEMKKILDFSSEVCNNQNLLSELFTNLLNLFNSYQKQHHKLLIILIVLWGYEEYEFPFKDINFSSVICNLFSNYN
jgi:hypothetical protein